MPLAGDMKLKNFLALAGVGLLGVGGLSCAGLSWLGQQLPERPEPTAIVAAPVAAPAPMPPPSPVAAPVAAPVPAPAAPAVPAGLTDVQQAVWAYRGRDLGSSKLKDVSKGRPYKINVYQDDGNPTANRAKVDLDRDDKWDEKWTFDGPTVQRKIAPADDEDYTETVVWDGAAWVPEG